MPTPPGTISADRKPSPEQAQSPVRRSRGRPSVEGVALIDNEILGVALEQFVKHGYGVSMTRIIRAAGVSKTTMYSRFASKEQLFRAIIRRQIAMVGETAPLGPAEDYYDLECGLENFANRTLEVSLTPEFQEVNRLIFGEARRFPELGAAAAERNLIGIGLLSHFIRDRAKKDDIPCKDPDTVAEMLILLMRGWYMNAMLFGEQVPAKERRDWVARSVRTLIASRPHW